MADELVDIVNEQDKVIGQASREEAHSNPEMIYRLVTPIIINSKGEVLIGKRTKLKDEQERWVIVGGGHPDVGEDPKDAAIREAKEESGIDVTNLQLIKKHYYESASGRKFTYIFEAMAVSEEISKFERKEFQAVQWVSLQELEVFELKNSSKALINIYNKFLEG